MPRVLSPSDVGQGGLGRPRDAGAISIPESVNQPGEAPEGAGDALSDVTQILAEQGAKLKLARDADFVSNMVTQLHSDLAERFVAAKSEAPEGAGDFADAFDRHVQEMQAAALEGSPSGEATRAARDIFERQALGFRLQAQTFEHDRAALHIVSNTEETLERLSRQAFRDPQRAPVLHEMGLSALNKVVAAGGIAEDRSQAVLEAFERRLAVSTVRGIVQRDPDAAKERLGAGEFDGPVGDADTLQNLRDEAEATVAREKERDRAASGAALRTFGVAVERAEAAFERGLAPAGLDALLTDARAAVARAEEDGDKERLAVAQGHLRQIQEIAADQVAVGEFSHLTLAAQGERLSELRAKDRLSEAEARLMGRFERLHESTATAIAEGNGLALARDFELFDEIAPLNLDDLASFAVRPEQAAMASALFGVSVSPFLPRDIEAIGRMVGQLDADGALDLMGRLRAGLGGESFAQATEQLARRHPGLSMAFRLAETRPGLAREILAGLRQNTGGIEGAPGSADPVFAAAFERVFGVAPGNVPASRRPHLEAALALRAAHASKLFDIAGYGGAGIEDVLQELAQAAPVPEGSGGTLGDRAGQDIPSGDRGRDLPMFSAEQIIRGEGPVRTDPETGLPIPWFDFTSDGTPFLVDPETGKMLSAPDGKPWILTTRRIEELFDLAKELSSGDLHDRSPEELRELREYLFVLNEVFLSLKFSEPDDLRDSGGAVAEDQEQESPSETEEEIETSDEKGEEDEDEDESILDEFLAEFDGFLEKLREAFERRPEGPVPFDFPDPPGPPSPPSPPFPIFPRFPRFPRIPFPRR